MKTFHGMILYPISSHFFTDIRLLKETVDFKRVEEVSSKILPHFVVKEHQNLRNLQDISI